MTVPRGQRFPSAGASARWSLVCWVWLIWHISDDRWMIPLNMSVPSDLSHITVPPLLIWKPVAGLSHLSRAELQRPRHASITFVAAQVGLQALIDVHKVTEGKHHIDNLAHRCAREVFRLQQSSVSSNGNKSAQISDSKLTAMTQRLIEDLDHPFWNHVIYSRVKWVSFKYSEAITVFLICSMKWLR